MTSVDRILSSLRESERSSPATLPELLCTRCAQELPVTGVGLALMTDQGHQGVLASTDGPARSMEELQFTLGEGPCLDAYRESRPVLQPDLAHTAYARWPVFGPAVIDAGIAAIFAFPLQIGAIRLGVLALYRATSGNLDDDAFSDALAYADAAVMVLLELQSRTEPGGGLHSQLSAPLADRSEIHQATGIITVQASVGLVEALLLLRAHAFAGERSVLDVAHDVVARRVHFRGES